MSWNLYDRLLASADSDSSICIEKEDGLVLTYADLARLSGSFANYLASIGVGAGHRVAAKVEKSVEAIALYLATLRAGAVYLPLNTAYTAAEADYFVRDAQPTLIVCDPGEASDLRAIAAKADGRLETLDRHGRGSFVDAAAGFSAHFDTVPRDKDDLAAILYTSGTTGRSKGAMLTHGNLVSNALTLVQEWCYSRDDILIHALPIFHIHGLFVACNVTFAARARLIFMQKFDAERILEAMARATVLMGVPTFYVRLLQSANLSAQSTSRMRLFVAGSAPLLAETHRDWKERTGHEILERYGMTETGMIASNPYEGPRIPGSVGRALPAVQVRITDPDSGAGLPAGEVGMIEVKGPNVFSGYWNMPEKTATEFRSDGFFITGDLGKRDPRGYLYIVGRGKDLIITGGFNVYPKEIETEIDAVPGVSESAVVGVPHADFGEGVTAAIVRSPGSSVDEGTILKALSARLAKFKQPKRVVFVEALPRNTMGKVQKNLLRERFADLYSSKVE
jgi:malonyl-CoA/methylmalonyl-CoA synthetase